MPPPVTASLAMPAAGALRAFLDHLVGKHGRGLEPSPGSRRLGGTAPAEWPWWAPARATRSC
jgi:hypothetical protein